MFNLKQSINCTHRFAVSSTSGAVRDPVVLGLSSPNEKSRLAVRAWRTVAVESKGIGFTRLLSGMVPVNWAA